MKHNTYISYWGKRNVYVDVGIYNVEINMPIFVIHSYDDDDEQTAINDMWVCICHDTFVELDDIVWIEFIGEVEREYEDHITIASYEKSPFPNCNQIWKNHAIIKFIQDHNGQWCFNIEILNEIDRINRRINRIKEEEEWRNNLQDDIPF